jgi:hypothetical protein
VIITASHESIDSVKDVTLQINLSAGDATYAALTVPALVAAHDSSIRRLAVVDCCRRKPTRIQKFDIRSGTEFEERLSAIRTLAEGFKKDGLFDAVAYLEPGDKRFSDFAGKYTRRWITETHDYCGCAHMAYWAALDLPRTRFVAHYDADMLLHQDPGFSWIDNALTFWPQNMRAVAAVPRMSPPGFSSVPSEDAPTRHEGRPKEQTPGGWLNDWFSTRCFLFDRDRLATLLPLIGPMRAAEFWLRKLVDRGYPPAPEQLLFRSLGERRWRCLNLSSEHAWLLHPTRKDADYLRLLPGIMASVAAGSVPNAQKGFADLNLDLWSQFQAGISDPTVP